MSLLVPDTLGECLQEENLAALDEALSPPMDNRPAVSLDVEIEDEEEETWILRYADGETEAEEGFADDTPFISIRMGEGAFAAVKPMVQAAAEHFPQAPLLAQGQARILGLSAAQYAEAHNGLSRLKDFKIVIHLGGEGTLALARGAMDEASRLVEVHLPRGALGELIVGKDPKSLAGVAKTSGEVGIFTQLLTALGPLALAIRGGNPS